MDYLSPATKAYCESLMANLADTYARPIVIFQTSQKTIILSNPQNNYIFDSGPNQTITQDVIVSGVFQARITYNPDQKQNMFEAGRGADGQAQVFQQIPLGDVRIKVSGDAKQFLINAKRVEFDGKIFNIRSDDKPHGMFTPQFYNYYLTLVK